jgi:N-acetyl-gamma-glutamylphosphate reductase
MTLKAVRETPQQTERNMADVLKGWTMTVLAAVFVLLYAAALFGWLRPLTDERMLTRLEPIIFVIIGYYFGRLPSQQNEKTLKEEAARQTQRADAAQHAKEQAQQSREVLEEKMKNARAALAPAVSGAGIKAASGATDKTPGPPRDEALRYAAASALNILHS